MTEEMLYILYMLAFIAVLIFTVWTQANVNGVFKKYAKVASRRGMTGKDAAEYILRNNGVYDVTVELVQGHLSDHYSPKEHVLRLSESTYNSTSVAAIGVAAHEAGHAIQHATGYRFIAIRNAIIPICQIGSWASWPIIVLGAIIASTNLVNIGLILFSTIVFFQLITLPVEFNASHRAVAVIESLNILDDEEVKGTKRVLRAAALTYVAALMNAVLQLLRLIMIFGRRDR